MRPIIQSLWIGSDLSNLEKLCVQSFLDHGHEFHLYTYDHVGGVPKGATIKDANDILPKQNIFISRSGTATGYSDWFRYALLAKNGGWWVDMDTICLKPYDLTDPIVFPQHYDPTNVWLFNNNPLRFPHQHPLMLEMENYCQNLPNKAGADDIATGGPYTLSERIHAHRLEKHGKSYQYFYPLPSYLPAFWDDSFADGLMFYPNTYSIHLGNSWFGTVGIDKNAIFSPHSAFEKLKQRHGIANQDNAPLITPTELRSIQNRRPEIIAKIMRLRKSRRNYVLAAAAVGLAVGAALG